MVTVAPNRPEPLPTSADQARCHPLWATSTTTRLRFVVVVVVVVGGCDMAFSPSVERTPS